MIKLQGPRIERFGKVLVSKQGKDISLRPASVGECSSNQLVRCQNAYKT